ncbi:MAG: hypothetical protein GC193_04950 [Cryomorphaceae bacterium]|nr:hypothetical protein [Cryomorphaceae bacterium]
MSHELTGWTTNEFEAFVLMIAANADLETDNKELKIIKAKAGDGYEKVEEMFSELNDAQRIDVVLVNKGHFLITEQDVSRMKQEVHDIMTANGHLSMIERGVEHMLDRMF